MTLSDYPLFLKWGEYTSHDVKKPDILEWIVTETDTFETKYAICVNARINNELRSVSLHSFNSLNKILLNLWNAGVRTNKIKPNVKFQLATWLEQSKTHKDRHIRRFRIIF